MVARHRSGRRALMSSVGIALSSLLITAAPTAAQQPSDSPGPGASAQAAGAVVTVGPWPWTELPGARAITAGGDRFVVVGSDDGLVPRARAWTSPDGLTWQIVAGGSAFDGAWMGVVTSVAEGFVALGTESATGTRGERMAAWFSSDGLSWERVPVGKPAKGSFMVRVTDVADGPAGLLALGAFIGQDLGGVRMWSSPDGRSWAPSSLPKVRAVTWSALASVPDGYLLMGADRKGKPSNWHSVDGTTWQKSAGSPWLKDAATNAIGTTVGAGLADLWATQDLASWRPAMRLFEIDDAEEDEQTLWVKQLGPGFVATGLTYTPCPDDGGVCRVEPLLVSPDGSAWSISDGPDGLPGSDPETTYLDAASLESDVVILGGLADGPVVGWHTLVHDELSPSG